MQKLLVSFQQYCIIIHCDVITVVYDILIPWVRSTVYKGKHVIHIFRERSKLCIYFKHSLSIINLKEQHANKYVQFSDFAKNSHF